MKRLFSASLLAAGLALGGAAHAAQPLLNVSYDVMRDFYKEYNPAFQKYWKAEKGENITIQMSHGGSSKQARSVIDGLPKTSGNGRYTYLSAWGYVLKNGGDENKAKEFVGKLFKQVPVLDTGGRAATTTFMQNQIGDVLVTFENEAEMIAREFGRGGFEVVYPSVSAEAEPPVAVVDKVVEKKGSRAQAEAYLKYLWSDEGQTIAANNYLRPRNPEILAKFADRFPKVDFFSVEKTFGDWRSVQKTHFIDGGVFDQIYSPN